MTSTETSPAATPRTPASPVGARTDNPADTSGRTDTDGSTDPAEIPRFVAALCRGADFAKGSRFRAGGGSTDITLLRRIGNDGLNTFVNLLFGTRFTDLCYGYNAFWREIIPALRLPAIEERGPLWGDGSGGCDAALRGV